MELKRFTPPPPAIAMRGSIPTASRTDFKGLMCIRANVPTTSRWLNYSVTISTRADQRSDRIENLSAGNTYCEYTAVSWSSKPPIGLPSPRIKASARHRVCLVLLRPNYNAASGLIELDAESDIIRLDNAS